MNSQVLTFIQMPKAQLLSSIRFDSRNSYKIKKEIRNKWVRESRCSCCNNPLIKSGKMVLTCEHIKKEWKKSTEEIEKRITKKTNCLLMKNLSEAYRLTKVS